ncbi:MAG: peptide chain release factor 3 [Planctomycetaceae bacterium]|nr:peptide chain release factor 3 [Planctomycetaceae bacterium]
MTNPENEPLELQPPGQPAAGDSQPASQDNASQDGASQDGGGVSERVLRAEIQKRRTFAIISHPDAGKTTLTEKLLLYSGRVMEAGAVRGRKSQRAVTSDWMAMERERGISITSTVLTFEHRGQRMNLLDTPGHEDFSEDTYRTLTAADCAVMVIDAVKGIEAQTEKLFRICAARKIPIVTFVNKLDRPGCEPLATLGHLEEVLGMAAVPLNWPIGTGRDFQGVYDRAAEQVLLFESVTRGAVRVPTTRATLEDACERLLSPERAAQLREDVELLDGACEPFDHERFLKGEITPVFFGSALSNFGVEPFLESFLDISPPPGPRNSDQGEVPPDKPEFAGVVFKIQANLDPRHRDRVAYVRVCAGRFARDMEVLLARTGEKIRIKRSHRVFAAGRETMDEAWPGDIIGLVNPGQFRLGDTLCEGAPLQYDGQWQFPPECFATLRCNDTSRRKQFSRGVSQLIEEGAIQVLADPQAMFREPVLAAVGELQFDVVQYRLESEYGTETTLHRLPYEVARWVTGSPQDLAAIKLPSAARMLQDQDGSPVALFQSQWNLNYCCEMNPSLQFHEIPGQGADEQN